MKGFKLVKEGHCKMQEIEQQKKYRIPASKVPVTHARVYAGKLSFFASVNGEKESIMTHRGKFFKKPEGATFVFFPDYYKNRGGHHYGEPKWYAVKVC